MADNNKKGKFKIGSIIRNLVLILAVGIFCYSGYQLITIYMEYKEGSDEYQDLSLIHILLILDVENHILHLQCTIICMS